MLENIYTTKMSANRKQLQNRFSKIRSKSGRISRLMAIFMSVAFLITMLCANVVMAMVDGRNTEEYKISIYKNGEEIDLTSKPFVENGNVYVPLREVIEKVVLENEGITDIKWNNGTIDVKIAYYQGESGIYRFNIGGSFMRVKHFTYSDSNNVSIDGNSLVLSISLNSFPILKSSTTYATVKDINNMLFGFTNRRDENKKLYGLTYSIFKSGNDITNIFEYEAELQKDQSEMTDPNRTLELFFKAFYNQEFEKMKRYCTEECVSDYFGDDFVFGMTKATLQQIGTYPNKTSQTSNDVNFQVTVNMIPHKNSVYDSSQVSATFFMVLQKQDDGRYLINEFATGI